MLTTPATATPTPVPPTNIHLAADVELLGRFEGSGYADPRYLIRRPDGSQVLVTELLFRVAQAVAEGDGGDADEVAARAADASGRPLTAADIEWLVANRLDPLGVTGDQPPPAPNPLLRLTLRATLLPAPATAVLGRMLRFLFWPPVVVALLAAVIAVDVWVLFGGHGGALEAVLAEPAWMLGLLGIVVASGVFHELGHAAACTYGGGRPGRIGVGLYVLWPAFYTDVSDALRLSRRARIRTDLGGVYFNLLTVLVLAAAYAITGAEPLLLAILIQHLEIAHQALPVLRLDGYYLVADITGIPEPFSKVRPLLSRLRPGAATDPAVSELRPAARRVITGWVLLTVPLLAAQFLFLLLAGPDIVTTGAAQLVEHYNTVTLAIGAEAWLIAVTSAVGVLLVAIPVVAVPLLTGRMVLSSIRWAAAQPSARMGWVAGGLTAAGAVAFLGI